MCRIYVIPTLQQQKKTQNTNVDAERSLEYCTRFGSISISTNDPICQRHKNRKRNTWRDVFHSDIWWIFSLSPFFFVSGRKWSNLLFRSLDSITSLYWPPKEIKRRWRRRTKMIYIHMFFHLSSFLRLFNSWIFIESYGTDFEWTIAYCMIFINVSICYYTDVKKSKSMN